MEVTPLDRSSEPCLLEENWIDVAAMTSSSVVGQICDWRTPHTYYRQCQYQTTESTEIQVEYPESFIQLLYVLRGKGFTTRFTTSQQSIRLEPGEFAILFHPEKEKRTVQVPACACQELRIVNLPATYFLSLPLVNTILASSAQKLKEGTFLGPLAISAELLTCLSQFHLLPKHDPSLQASLLEVKIQELILLTLEAFKSHYGQPAGPLNPEALQKIHRLGQLLAEHPEQDYTLKQLAQHILSNPTFIKLNFKKVYHKTVFAYLTALRMEKAQELLTNQTLSVAEVASQVGYKHATHFSAAFKKYYGVLPKHFKKESPALDAGLSEKVL